MRRSIVIRDPWRRRAFVWLGGALFVGVARRSLRLVRTLCRLGRVAPRPGVSWPAARRSTSLLFAVFAAASQRVRARSASKRGVARRPGAAAAVGLRLDRQPAADPGVRCSGRRSAASSITSRGWRAFALAAVQLTGVWLIAQSVRGDRSARARRHPPRSRARTAADREARTRWSGIRCISDGCWSSSARRT